MVRLLTTLCLFAGLTCIWGGVELALAPDGSMVGLPPSLLRYSPFPDFTIPGLLLAIVVGGANAVAGLMVLARRPTANAAAVVAATALGTWLAVEVVLLRSFHWLHAAFFALALSILAVAAVREARAARLEVTVRSLGRLTVHAIVGWAFCAAIMGRVLATTNLTTAVFVHVLAAPAIFVAVSTSYFSSANAWKPFHAALSFVALTALLDLVIVACFVEKSLAMYGSVPETWLPLAAVFCVTWATGIASSARGVPRGTRTG